MQCTGNGHSPQILRKCQTSARPSPDPRQTRDSPPCRVDPSRQRRQHRQGRVECPTPGRSAPRGTCGQRLPGPGRSPHPQTGPRPCTADLKRHGKGTGTRLHTGMRECPGAPGSPCPGRGCAKAQGAWGRGAVACQEPRPGKGPIPRAPPGPPPPRAGRCLGAGRVGAVEEEEPRT